MIRARKRPGSCHVAAQGSGRISRFACLLGVMLLANPGSTRGQPEQEDVFVPLPPVILGQPSSEEPAPAARLPENVVVKDDPPPTPTPSGQAFDIRLEMPSKEELFRPESEAGFRARLVQEAERRKIQLQFPKDYPYADAVEPILELPTQTKTFFPATVCFRPLYFDNDWTERYGLYNPCLQPLVSTAKFYWKTLTLPYNVLQQPPWVLHCRDGY